MAQFSTVTTDMLKINYHLIVKWGAVALDISRLCEMIVDSCMAGNENENIF